MKLKNRRKKKGFTLFEVIIVIAIMAILMMMMAPKLKDMANIGESLSNSEKHRMVIFAIETWSQENKWSYQRPGDFEVRNSQGKTVVDYLKTTDFEAKTDGSGVVFLEDSVCKVTFAQGVLRTENIDSHPVERVYTVFETEDSNVPYANIKLKDWAYLRNIHTESEETPEQYARKIKDKNQKKLLLKEDNAL